MNEPTAKEVPELSRWYRDGQGRSDELHERVQQFARDSVSGSSEDLGQAKWEATRKPRDEQFEALALDIARYQSEFVPGFGRLVQSTSRKLETFEDIPAVPVDAFRMTRVAAHPSVLDEVTFLTSGTTSGVRGGHHFRRTDTYRMVALLWGRMALLPAATNRARVISIAPRPSSPQTSSLGFMMQAFAETFDSPEAANQPGVWLLNDERIDLLGLEVALKEAKRGTCPLLILATSFALVYLLDELKGRSLETPPGTVVMQTGGFKGKTRQIDADQLRKQVAWALSLPPHQVVSEYGMTELSSQLYEGTVFGGALQADAGFFLPPPWLRVQALDAEARRPLADGAEGLACFTDLANIDSAVRIVTMDRIILDQGRVQLLGRQPGAPPRGCSLAIEELLR